MQTTLEVLFTPADFTALKDRDLSATCCVVFDILRATSSMVTALANGAEAIIPVADIPEALSWRKQDANVLLAGERHGLRIDAALTGGTEFDLGNSPREFTPEKVQGRTIVMTTTNGTRALRSCAQAKLVLAGSFLNLRATARYVLQQACPHLLLVCSGTLEQCAYEDTLAAGAFCELILQDHTPDLVTDSALIARKLYQLESHSLSAALASSRNGRRLQSRPELAPDIACCARMDMAQIVAALHEGRMKSTS